MIAVVGKMFPWFESRKATDHPITFHGKRLAIITTDDPLASFHREDTVTVIPDGDVVDKGVRLIGRGRQIGSINNPIHRCLESIQELRLHLLRNNAFCRSERPGYLWF